jgi:hypothetical protein
MYSEITIIIFKFSLLSKNKVNNNKKKTPTLWIFISSFSPVDQLTQRHGVDIIFLLTLL